MSTRPTQLGHSSGSPLILGAVNGAPARLVEGTGLYLSVRKGTRRWVTGTAVQAGLQSGVLVEVYEQEEQSVESEADRRRRLAGPTKRPGANIPAPPAGPPDTQLGQLRQHEAVLQGAEPGPKPPAKSKGATKKAPAQAAKKKAAKKSS